MRLRMLTWNLFHGRSQPAAGRDLRHEFTAALAGWDWDVAALQEVPPWWPGLLAADLGAEQRTVLTSRNAFLPLRRAIAMRHPDLIKSNGGGANAILARRDRIVADRARRLRRWPEGRVVHVVHLACGIWIANVHASAGNEAAALHDGRMTAQTALEWAHGRPLLVGGDFNLREPRFDGLEHVAGYDVDHVFVANGVHAVDGLEVLERRTLSDHAPLTVNVVWTP